MWNADGLGVIQWLTIQLGCYYPNWEGLLLISTKEQNDPWNKQVSLYSIQKLMFAVYFSLLSLSSDPMFIFGYMYVHWVAMVSWNHKERSCICSVVLTQNWALDGCMHGWMYAWMDAWGWMGGMEGGMDGEMDGWDEMMGWDGMRWDGLDGMR